MSAGLSRSTLIQGGRSGDFFIRVLINYTSNPGKKAVQSGAVIVNLERMRLAGDQ